MNTSHSFGRWEGFGDNGRLTLAIAPRDGGPRFARRSSRLYSSDYDEEEEPREERPRRAAPAIGTSWLIAGFVLAVGVVIVLVVANKSTPSLLSFDEFQNRISGLMGGQRVFPVMSAQDFVSRVGVPITGRDFDDTNYVYHYYRVKEGTVEIVMDKPSWKAHQVRIIRIMLQ